MIELSQQRFEALAGYTRLPQIILLIQEAAWFSTGDALVPLDPDLIPDVNHEFLKPDGSIMSLLPPFQPYISHTSVTIGD